MKNKDKFHYCYSDEYQKLCERVFDVMISCKTVEHWEVCKKYNELAVSNALKKSKDNFDRTVISSFGSFRRGFIAGMLQSLKEEQRYNAVQDYLSLGC